jgi:hypothetical protein
LPLIEGHDLSTARSRGLWNDNYCLRCGDIDRLRGTTVSLTDPNINSADARVEVAARADTKRSEGYAMPFEYCRSSRATGGRAEFLLALD